MNKLEISRGFQQGIILPSFIIFGNQPKFNCRKRIQESKQLVLKRLVLNSLFQMIKTTSVASGRIRVGKLYNQEY